MNVQEILNKSIDNKRLGASMVNQSQEVTQRMGLVGGLPQSPTEQHNIGGGGASAMAKYHN